MTENTNLETEKQETPAEQPESQPDSSAAPDPVAESEPAQDKSPSFNIDNEDAMAGMGKTAEKLRQDYPEMMEATNEEEFREAALKAETEAGVELGQAGKKIDHIIDAMSELGAWFVAGEGKIRFNDLLDFVLRIAKDGRASAEKSRSSEAGGDRVLPQEFENLLKHPDQFAKTLAQSYQKGELNQLKDFYLKGDSLAQAEAGDSQAFRQVLIDLKKAIYKDENWAAFKVKFAEAMYPGKTKVLDDDIRLLIKNMVENDKFDQYFSLESAQESGAAQPAANPA